MFCLALGLVRRYVPKKVIGKSVRFFQVTNKTNLFEILEFPRVFDSAGSRHSLSVKQGEILAVTGDGVQELTLVAMLVARSGGELYCSMEESLKSNISLGYSARCSSSLQRAD